MARPEKQIPPDSAPPLRALAQQLRQMRAAAGLSYNQLSARTHYSTATLSRAASGRSVPSWKVVSAIATAAQLPPEERSALAALHREALKRQEERASRQEAREAGFGLASQEAIDTESLSRAMQTLYQAAGRPSVREISKESGVPRSTVHRVLTGQAAVSPAPEEPAAEIARTLLPLVPPETRNELTHRSSELKALFRSFRTEWEKAWHRHRVQGVLAPLRAIGILAANLERLYEVDAAGPDDAERLLEQAQELLDQARQHLDQNPRPEPLPPITDRFSDWDEDVEVPDPIEAGHPSIRVHNFNGAVETGDALDELPAREAADRGEKW
ncbi:helix-turn-helix domain-containing protein [Streptomyces sp. NPDC092369]|uniref:helix-turn-helix domain-containing protein n=1 Tax=Streptomyces sp. NPDC092369 TaxID=3366015 RepID=UPI003805C2FE